MTYIAAFDLGTTAIKGVLLNQEGQVKLRHSYNIHTYYGENNEIEQNPEEWWKGLQAITHEWFTMKGIPPASIKAITFSSQMEDVILIKEGECTNRAILYSDNRAFSEALSINQQFPDLKKITGNTITSATPVSKLVWLKNHELMDSDEKVHVVFSAKDYIIYKLTGSIVTDYVTASTSGILNIKLRKWNDDLLNALNIEQFVLPKLVLSEQQVGHVLLKAKNQTGFEEGIPVLCGAGDAGASTLGAGAISEGDCYMYLGTTGWVALPSKNESPKTNGVFTLAHVIPNMTISIAPLLNVGNVHRWAVETFFESINYDEFEEIVERSPPGANNLLFLPYMNGERCPVKDNDAKGAFWGIGPKTTKYDFLRATIEGICFSLYQITQMLVQTEINSITLIGGGAKSKVWCQSLADITNKIVKVPNNSEYLPSIGISATAFIHLGWVESYQTFVEEYINSSPSDIYYPTEESKELYKELYKRYLKLYPSLVNIYN